MASEEEEEDEGPLLKPLGDDGAPFSAVGEWLVPFVTERGKKKKAFYVYKMPTGNHYQSTKNYKELYGK